MIYRHDKCFMIQVTRPVFSRVSTLLGWGEGPTCNGIIAITDSCAASSSINSYFMIGCSVPTMLNALIGVHLEAPQGCSAPHSMALCAERATAPLHAIATADCTQYTTELMCRTGNPLLMPALASLQHNWIPACGTIGYPVTHTHGPHSPKSVGQPKQRKR